MHQADGGGAAAPHRFRLPAPDRGHGLQPGAAGFGHRRDGYAVLSRTPNPDIIQQRLDELLALQDADIDGWYYSPAARLSDDDETIDFPDRKPGPGMLLAAAAFVFVPFLGAGDVHAFLAIIVVAGLTLGADLAMPGAMLADVVDEDTSAPSLASR